MSTTTTVTTPATADTSGLWTRIYADAAAIWHRVWGIDQEVEADIKTHPEIVAATAAVEADFPPDLRKGIDVAGQIATAVQSIADHAAQQTPATAPQPQT